MKLILCAVALAFATPAAAQSAPAADHSQMDHSKMDHGQHKADAPKAAEEHKHMCPMMKDGKKGPCCDKHGDGKAKAPAAHGDHGGH